MFCRRCGNEVYEGEMYCSECGAPLNEIEPVETTQEKIHDRVTDNGTYERLGGWLLVFVILHCIGLAINTFSVIVVIIATIRYAAGRAMLILVPTVAMIFFQFKYIIGIIQKDPKFLLNYHIAMGINVLSGVVMQFAGLTEQNIMNLAGQIIIIVLLTVYFVQSRRVITYMGSDRFLREDPLTRNAKAAEPFV